ncbi:MAG: right-handed parallel beta-helix repeat-containing protein [Clostridia bacterium]|nr:right-handed parallel beta-helix repeat-containing protein [Clostridia bacterium]
MEKTRRNKILTVAASSVLAVCMFGGVVALGACKGDGNAKNKEISIEYSYTPERGNGKTYYVSADVAQFTSESCDGSYENPYNILDLIGWGSSGTHSYDSILEPGDTVLVMPGQYTQTTSVYVEKSGTYDNYITIMNAAYADDGHTYESTSATISLYGEAFDGNNRGVTMNSDYIYWYGIDVAGAGDNGMYIGGSHNVIENCQFYNNRDTGLQLGRKSSDDVDIKDWPSYNLIKNCTSFNNYDNHTYGENADGFGAKLTIGYGNVFDGCIAYRNSDDGWDLYAKEDTGNIGCVIIYNCIAFENGYLLNTQAENNARFGNTFSSSYAESNTNSYTTRDGDGNGFKLGGGSNEGDVKLYNCMSFNNRMHGVTDNSNPGTLQIDGVTSYNNCASIDNSAPVEVETPESSEDNEATDDTQGELTDGTQGDTTEAEGSDDEGIEEEEPEEIVITFGQIKYDGGTEDSGCANIDLARWSYSYNTLSNVLSVIDGNSKTANDAYRGATTNCVFNNYYVDGTVDADNKNDGGIKGTSYKQASAGDIFEETPALNLGVRTTFDENGVVNLGVGNIHNELRFDDGTIYAGDMLKIKSNASLVLSGVGADLSKTAWEDYTHYEYTCGQSSESADADTLTAIYNMVYLPVCEDAVFQNFKVVNSIWDVRINWTSSVPDVLRVTNNVTYTTSNSSTVGIEVSRDPEGDRQVTLTAEMEYGGYKIEKEYDLTVRKDIPSIGDVVVDGVEMDQVIVDQYSAFPEPAVTIENGSDYNGKILDTDLYTIETTYEYAPTAADTFDEIGVFTTSNAGVYRITLDISINSPDELAAVTQKTYTYLIYVASKDAEVQFVGTPTLTVYRDGFTITGNLSSPTGYIYVLKSETALTGTGTEGEVLATDVTGNSDAVVDTLRETSMTRQYADSNNAGYYVYCVLTSLDGTQLSDVYTLQANVTEISDATGFESMIENNNSSTIYLLTSDIDYGTYGSDGELETNGTFTADVKDKVFKGLLNGMGHTIKNLSTTERAIFARVDGGTIENIKFENISVVYTQADKSNTENAAGLIGYMTGGYLYNIAATDITVSSNGQRVGGIVGQINSSSGTSETTYIDGISLVNTYTHEASTVNEDGSMTRNYTGAVIEGDERVGGIVGFIQCGSTAGWNEVYITNCYVNAYITASGGIAAGIVGRSDDRNSNDYLMIDQCNIYGVIESTSSGKSYLGGVIGQFTGTGATRISRCTSYGQLWFGNESIRTSLKNASWIVGNFAANGDIVVTSCYAYSAEYNEEYGVNTNITTSSLTSWTRYCPMDMESGYWEFVLNNSGSIMAPYLQLIFQGEWDLGGDETTGDAMTQS